jgi:medium-chain acyl-[acyl-carrier-protein] hydrolase
MRLQPFRSSWVRISCPRPTARVRLICLPFAGGSANSYWEWPTWLPEHVEVVPIQLPGRGNRFDEPAIDSAGLLVNRLLAGLMSYLDRPFALFGHSMGALVAFEITTRLRVMGLEPVHFFASGCKAPHLPSDRSRDRRHLPDREFIAAVSEMNGVPHEVLENADLMELVLPALRSDFKLVETYQYRSQPPLRCPISAFGGLQDNEVTQDEIEAWSCHTVGSFQVHMLPGDHFFVNSSRVGLLRLIAQQLVPTSSQGNDQ